MKTLFTRRLALTAVALACTASAGAAETFPSRPIKIVVTSAPGGAVDVTTRVVAQRMSEKLGQPVVVENRVGAGGLVAIRFVKSAPADGYTLLASVNTIAIQQAVSRDPGYAIAKDFIGVGPMTRSPFLLMTSPSQPDKTLPALLAHAKASPGAVTYASAGNGSTTHLAMAIFAQRAGLDLQHVPYKGNSAAWPDLISSRVGLLVEPYSTGAGMIRAGQLKALAVTSTTRLEVLPDVPTFAEQGVPNYSFYLWMGLLAPAGTPKDVVYKLNDAMRSVLASPDLKKRFRDEGSEEMVMPSEEFTQFLVKEADTFTKLVSDLHIPKE